MLSIKNTLIAGAAAFAVGFLTGYSARDDQAEIERLNFVQSSLEQERENLIKQLEVEHEHQKTAQINAAKTQEDLDDLEKRYANAVDELNALQLSQLTYVPDGSSALSSASSSTSTVSQGKCGCSGADKIKFQRLYEKQLMISKDCDINATYLNNLIEWYGSISK